MNERIRKLAEQSGFFPVPDDTETDWEYRAENARYEKFAELIIKECVKICDKVYEQNDNVKIRVGATFCREDIKEHFGVDG